MLPQICTSERLCLVYVIPRSWRQAYPQHLHQFLAMGNLCRLGSRVVSKASASQGKRHNVSVEAVSVAHSHKAIAAAGCRLKAVALPEFSARDYSLASYPSLLYSSTGRRTATQCTTQQHQHARPQSSAGDLILRQTATVTPAQPYMVNMLSLTVTRPRPFQSTELKHYLGSPPLLVLNTPLIPAWACSISSWACLPIQL